MPHQVFTDDYIRKLCPENQPIPLKKMSVLRSPKPPKYVESLPGIRYVPPVTRPPVTVNTLARAMAPMSNQEKPGWLSNSFGGQCEGAPAIN